MRRRGCWMALLGALGALALPLGAAAAGIDAGDVAIVDASVSTRPTIDEGDSNTVFSLRLPSGAACPGDSANDQWRVQSFVVPAGDDPADIVYSAIGPEGPPDGLHTDARWALYGPSYGPYADELTQKNVEAGRPGVISLLPPFSFEDFRPEHLPPGRYRLGIACTPPDRATAVYWDTEIQVTPAPDVLPGGFRWSVVGTPDIAAPAGSDDASVPWVIVGAAAIGLAGCLVAVRQRGARRTVPLIKEHS